MGERPSERLGARGVVLPPPPRPVGSYAPVVVVAPMAFVAGQIVVENGRAISPGRVGREVDPTTAAELARRAALQALSALAEALGSIDRVGRIARLTVYVAASEGFDRVHEVANGASDLLVEVFGEAGRGARVAIGVSTLPLNAPVEVELAVTVTE